MKTRKFTEFAVFVCLFLSSGVVTEQSYEPLWQTEGEPRVVVLVDLHGTLFENGTCGDMKPRVVERVLAMKWLHSVLQNDDNMQNGISVYDTCGSRPRALQIVTSHIAPLRCSNASGISGVISHTKAEIREAISNILEPLGILHINIDDDSYIAKGNRSTLTIPTFSIWKIQAVVELLKNLDWNYVSSYSDGTENTNGQLALFMRMAKEYDICISDYGHDLNNISWSSSESRGSVIFTSENLNTEKLIQSLDHSSHRYIVVNNNDIGKRPINAATTALHMAVKLNSRPAFLAYVASELLQRMDSFSLNYLSMLDFCEHNTTLNQTVCSDKLNDYLEVETKRSDITAILTAYYNMDRVTKMFQELNCSHYDYFGCPLAFSYVTMKQSVNEFPFNLQEPQDGLFFDEPVRVDISLIGIPTAEIGLVYQTTFSPTNLSVWKSVKSEMGISTCNSTCHICDICKHTGDTELQDVQMKKNGDLLISGVFPVRQNSDTGESCGSVSTEGIQMAEAVFYAVDTIKSRHREQNLFPGVAIGALVRDSCKLQHAHGKYRPQTCSVSSNISPIKSTDVTSYLQVLTDVNQPSHRFLLSSFGVSLNKISLDRYIKAFADMLSHVNWTYIHVVFSRDVYDDPHTLSSIKYIEEKNICIASKTVIDHNETSALLNIDKLLNESRKTGAVLLLTNSGHTYFILETLHNNNKAYTNLNLIVLPWDSDIKRYLLPGSIMLEPKPEGDTNFQNYLSTLQDANANSRNPWWKEFYERQNMCYAELDTNVLYTVSCDSMTNNLDFSSSAMAVNVIQAVDAMVLALDKLYKELCPLQSGLCADFRNYDIDEFLRSEAAKGTLNQDFTVHGEFKLPFEIINYQLMNGTGTSMPVGIYSVRDELIIDTNAIKTYNETNTPYIASHVCEQWCPSCFTCTTEKTEKTGYLYNSGDLVIAGIFPLHYRGSRALTCGTLALNKGSEVLVEAFLYSLKTFRARYPYLLPNVEVGSLTIDSCSDSDSVAQEVMNFESCLSTFDNDVHQTPLSPSMIPSYVSLDFPDVSPNLNRILQSFGKYSLSFDDRYSNSDPASELFRSFSKSGVITIVNLLDAMDWSYVDLVISADDEHVQQKDWFMELTKSYNICVSVIVGIDPDSAASISAIRTALVQSSARITVMLASTEAIRDFFGDLNNPSKLYILGESDLDWEDTTGILMPFGTIVVDRLGKLNNGFKTHYEALVQNDRSDLGNHWFREISRSRAACGNANKCLLPSDILLDASKIVLGVDALLHALHSKYTTVCSQTQGLCREFASVGASLGLDDFQNVSFLYQGEMIKLPLIPDLHGSYVIKNRQTSGFVEVGGWKYGLLRLESNKIKAYHNNGNQRGTLPTSVCYNNCKCANVDIVVNVTTTVVPVSRTDLTFYDRSQEFDSQLWAIVVLAISCGGALISLIFIVYVLVKVCRGLLQKRYVGLGIMLLVSILALYLSVLPFVFTPSENVCSLRFFLPGLTYAFVYAVILSKLMSLRAYKLIGLGGEISNINQFLTVLFVTGVQIAIGVQWWIIQDSMLVTQASFVEPEVTNYACNFIKKDFVIYNVYNMFLIVLSAFYAILVRNETKNMGEAKLILISSWLTILVWAAWEAVLLIQPLDFAKPTICVGIIVSASVTILVVFVPKLHRISKLQYDVKKSGMENGGYKIDTDFLFERPYTLPGMRSSFKYSEKTNPKSISQFDTSLSY